MKTLIWSLVALLVLLWSALAWAVHVLLGASGAVISGNADLLPVPPEMVELTSWLASAGAGVGEWLIIALWAIVSAVILASGFVLTRLTPRFKAIPIGK